MSLYPFLVFLHVIAAMGLFAAIAIEAVALGRLRQADAPASVREGMGLLARNERLGGIAMLTLIASGAWMMATTWGHQWWIVSAFIGIIGMGVAGGAVSSRRIRRLRAALAAERGPGLSQAFTSLQSSTALVASLRVRIALGVGIVALMTLKPSGAGTSLLILAAFAVAGLVAILPLGAGRSQMARGSEA
ncbi:MAG TPA: hypothetical protein VLC54_06615 [Anaeromyxobacter sp.]|nr:hypothetical protein [Anaeromyxobacter sp.]